jgi:hypothetical protein
MYKVYAEAKFLDEVQTKVLRVFLLGIHSHPLHEQLCLEISISSQSRNLLCISSNPHNLLPISTASVTIHCKGERRKT